MPSRSSRGPKQSGERGCASGPPLPDVIGDPTNGEIGIGVRNDDRHVRRGVELSGPEGSADACVTATYRNEMHDSGPPQRLGVELLPLCIDRDCRSAAEFELIGEPRCGTTTSAA